MLVNLTEILTIAEQKKNAIGAFNTPSLASLLAVIRAAEELKSPVIVQMAEAHDYAMSLEVIGPVMMQEAAKASVPVCVHLDHGGDLAYLERAVKLGFTGLMFDGSHLPYDENVDGARKTMALAKMDGAGVEAEFGVMATQEDGKAFAGGENVYTDPDEAARFVQDTGINALACSFGTVHGVYLKQPKLDFERIVEIRRKVGIPLVMHGGSGVSEEDYRKVIARGVRKINYYTYMAKAGTEGVRKALEANSGILYHDLVTAAIESMQADVMRAMKVFSEPETLVE